MKNINSLPLQILEILRQYPDQEHLISMPELQAILEADGFPSNRRTVYRAIDTLREYNYDIRYEFISFILAIILYRISMKQSILFFLIILTNKQHYQIKKLVQYKQSSSILQVPTIV